ncbi:hypothetical protein METBIDRAFT_35330 [Metschnikowia bicuspidata var. bicuspidata NRRL YB-4993]|uniref:Uncharacterized protein n=1 Tax=Metschnikowia bicuspidata var. bicuspidata NRRL YB-4993 TaxID=869754 RepID=A0A1A0HHQ2_9ASCO|nr:hypothetical protein METBIDRAFT_35330 [Metschnikowia bicuspidata var. bicuspidata NRRL YB-4993]OBA23373.1 hypothetical protein METBIDRAFT_35330 [Metschnikowia bicuspidata var. bicuspidata NRRL YB-4993]
MIRSFGNISSKVKLVKAPYRFYSVKFSENFDGNHPAPTKPKLSEFKNPLLHTFLLASATYMALQALWSALEYEHVEAELLKKSQILETEMQEAIEDARKDMVPMKRGWLSSLKFWKS